MSDEVLPAPRKQKGERPATRFTGPLPAPRPCRICGRAFIPTRCESHCVPGCCRKAGCPNTEARVPRHQGQSGVDSKCRVCHIPRAYFQRFAPCSPNCTRTYYGSSRGDTKFWGNYSRRWLCRGLHSPDLAYHHRPTRKPRIHIKYCSLRCYNSISWGHDTRRLQGERGRRYKQREYRNWKRRLDAGDRRWVPNRTRYISHVGPPRPS